MGRKIIPLSESPSSIRIVKFGGLDRPDDLAHSHLQQLIEECEDLYPGIDAWFKRKVSPGLDTGERSAILIYNGLEPVGSAVIRNDSQAKLCSLRVKSSFQHSAMGHLLMDLIALELRHPKSGFGFAKSIHFTLPESMWVEYGDYFKKYGFHCLGPANNQYRLFDNELACSADFREVLKQALLDLPDTLSQIQFYGSRRLPDILMSIRPCFANKILSGSKKIEVRTEFSVRWKGAKVVFYASDPQQELVGEGVIDDISIDTPSNIWERYGDLIGCSHEEYLQYCGFRTRVSALRFENVLPYKNRIPRAQLQVLMDEDLRPPISFNRLSNNRGWRTAVSLNSILK